MPSKLDGQHGREPGSHQQSCNPNAKIVLAAKKPLASQGDSNK